MFTFTNDKKANWG